MSLRFETENDFSFATVFSPFNDTDEPVIQRQQSKIILGKQGIDTREIDFYRQGVELQTSKHLSISTMPKIWAGNLNHYTDTRTQGQARSFSEFQNDIKFNDRTRRFNPVQFMTDPNYPRPIVFNDGPQQKEEATIYPFTIPFAKDYNEVNPANKVWGTLEDGNIDIAGGGMRTSIIEQFKDFETYDNSNFFLDEGQEYIGTNSPDDSIIIEGYLPSIERGNIPFDDTSNTTIVKQVMAGSDLIEVLKGLKMNLDEDLRIKYNRASATAGTSVYGINSARYGTDSIAYANLIRGA
jgi:hypothetical protein